MPGETHELRQTLPILRTNGLAVRPVEMLRSSLIRCFLALGNWAWRSLPLQLGDYEGITLVPKQEVPITKHLYNKRRIPHIRSPWAINNLAAINKR